MEIVKLGFALVVTMVLVSINSSFATDAPNCLDKDKSSFDVNNDQVINWETNTANEYHDRGNVAGTISKLYADETDHNHFELQFTDTQSYVEIVYDKGFGKLPTLAEGMSVQACGDYITSNAPYQSYSPSPDGALIHWVHWSDEKSHPSGFLMINGEVYGQKHSVPSLMTDALSLEISR